MEEKVQLSNYNRPDKYCMFIPWTTMGALADTQLRRRSSCGRRCRRLLEPKATRQVREFLANRYRYNPTDERALNMFGSAKTNEITGGIVGGLQDRADVHRRADARHRRRRHHEHHVRQRAGADARDRRAQGARRDHAAKFCCSSCSKGWRRRSPAASIGIAVSYALVWLLSPRPFLAELLDDASGVTDIHLVLSPGLVLVSASILMLVGLVSRPASGVQGVAARSDRSAAL